MKKMGIGLIAPAGYIEKEEIQAGIQTLEAQGFRVKTGNNLFGKYRYFSGKVSHRVKDIHDFLDDPEIHVLYAVRGGSGSNQLLPYINYQRWSKTGKVFVGFSDITAMQWSLWYRADVTCWSGMTLTFQLKKSNPYLKLFFRHLRGTRRSISSHDLRKEKLVIARKGKAQGILLGGTLSIIVSLLGTPYFPQTNQPLILFVEDVNEPVYRIERSIVQLKQAGVFKNIQGLILGRFKVEDNFVDIWHSIRFHFPEDIPVILNFPYGHFAEACALPVGLPVTLTTHPFKISW